MVVLLPVGESTLAERLILKSVRSEHPVVSCQLEVAEREGFEPTVLFRYSRFPGVRLKPLSHLSDLFHPALGGKLPPIA
jgi:hypothetical protein